MTTVHARPTAPWRRVTRTWHDAVLVVIGAVVLVLSALPVHQYSVSPAETDVFRAINDHTVLPFVVVWPIMQLGNFVAVPIAAVIAAVLRRFRLALAMLAAGIAAYFLAKVVKDIVVRGRPASLLDDVRLRGASALGRGYVSGHAAVVTLLAVLVWPYLGKRWRWVAVGVAVFVCLARVYVGAHLPLDVVGGAALGLAIGGLARLAFGRPVS
ncbi:MAG TPA: phosphatase PAP2 family protein [Jatrophihabitans sp.]|jgi:undecaprenyl-diphosphatase